MNEFDISGITGVSDKRNFSIQNNYRFDALIRAIDFFSQKFNLETLIDFAGDFINEILTLNASAVFVYNSDRSCFVAEKIRIYKNNLHEIPSTKKLHEIATLHGTIITGGFASFFSEEFIAAFKPALLLPLIHNGLLIGFIVTDGKVLGDFDEDDYSMAKALMRLFNDAFERNFLISELSQIQKKVDKLSFELLAANRVTGILFKEIDEDTLFTTGIEALSEVSGSSAVSFSVMDSKNNELTVKVFKDYKGGVSRSRNISLVLVDKPEIPKHNHVFHVEKDASVLRNIFKSVEDLKKLEADYVVFPADGQLSCAVTLGKTKASRCTNETFDVISSLAIELEHRYGKIKITQK